MDNNEEHIIIWEAPKIEPPEFRVYYDDTGRITCYSCEKLPGNYIVIDALTYAQSRPDLRVIDGKLSSVNPKAIITKLKPDTQGQRCSKEDISIIADDSYAGETTTWKLDIYELR